MKFGHRHPLGTSMLVAAIASIGAGVVHAAAAGTHNDDTTLAWLFAACAVAQVGWAGLAAAWPGAPTAAVGVALNGGCVGVWVLTRTVGFVGPLADIEPVGTQDAIAAALGAVAAGAALLALAGFLRGSPDARVRRLDLPVIALATVAVAVLAVPAAAAPHDHDSGHEHGTTVAAGHVHGDASESSATTPAHDHTSTGVVDAGPVVSLADPRLTSTQRARATDLLARTRDAMRAFPDEDAIVAAGYTWIGDGRRPGGFQHFVHAGYLGDGRMLDPAHIESIVLQVQPDGVTKVLVSAMYIAETGTTMETVPDIGGELTAWHDHQNLCWDGNKIAGVLVNGVCRPGGTFRPTAPMIHVWMDDPPCGPFTGIEGHGGAGCEHTHAGA